MNVFFVEIVIISRVFSGVKYRLRAREEKVFCSSTAHFYSVTVIDWAAFKVAKAAQLSQHIQHAWYAKWAKHLKQEKNSNFIKTFPFLIDSTSQINLTDTTVWYCKNIHCLLSASEKILNNRAIRKSQKVRFARHKSMFTNLLSII